ncbi:MAG TPA: phosphoglucosamine mutase [Candidatus Polarisedimenticolaceae bacterium]|nr:phosphoglucosamine mutase [Candidatus Polarisedimenticolaceae bacterium]
MKQLFGTDGIRAVAGEYPLDAPTVRVFGRALAQVLSERLGRPPRVVIGRDTRASGSWLTAAVAQGITAGAGTSVDAGVLPTPGLAFATRSGRFDAGVMISASHNPFEDNGLKVFGGDGMKIPDALEAKIEALILAKEPPPAEAGDAVPDGELATRYVRELESFVARGRLSGLNLVLDCANGAASTVAPRIFRDLGAKVSTIGCDPDGRNINLDCGSLHLDGLAARVTATGADVGLAFDGDADRCLAVDRKGRVVDGDHILFLVGRRLKREGRLRSEAIVATIMSNFWLEKRLADLGIRLHRAPVGDKYVLEAMIEGDIALGGEQSGHVIYRERSTTGDGILTGLLLLDTLRGESESLESILDGIVPFPQKLINVRVKEKPDLRAHPQIGPVVSQAESELAGRGRVVLRYSGTEPLARVMVEADDEKLVSGVAERLAGAIRERIGA